jgi:hypothetical protein
MSAAFCGVEVLARECRGGVTDKWNNMMGACSAGCVGNIGKGPGDLPSLHPPFCFSEGVVRRPPPSPPPLCHAIIP